MRQSNPENRETLLGQIIPAADHFGAGVALVRSGRITWASPRLEEFADPTPGGELIGLSLTTLLEDVGDGLPARDGATEVECALQGNDPDEEESELGRRVRVTFAGALSIAEEAQDEVWVFQDASPAGQRQRMSQALGDFGAEIVKLRDQVMQRERERDELIALLSHELRTPLTIISGYSKLLLSGEVGELSEEQRRFLEESCASCERLNSFVMTLLEATSQSSIAFSIERETAPLEATVRNVVSFFTPLLLEKNLSVRLDIQDDLPLAHFDPMRVEQVLTNLLGNAVKYTTPGSVIDVGLSRRDSLNGSVTETAVVDDGPGIGEEDRERIFEPYVRSGITDDVPGVGLGLAICRRIVEAHGGEIRVISEPGRGSRFIFTIPGPESDGAQGS
jgi:signal transduction histidine kinase